MLLSAAPDLTYAVLTNILHGVNYIVFIFSLAVFINKQVPDELKASGVDTLIAEMQSQYDAWRAKVGK